MNNSEQTKYSRVEVQEKTLEYFEGDNLATDVWINKYALKDHEGNIYELTPDDMHHRLAREFARIESSYISDESSLSEETIYDLLKDFKYIIPQGSPMSGIGNDFQTISLANCFVIGNDSDSYGGILKTDQELAHLMKRRGGCGTDISHIRPKGCEVRNAAIISTGVVPFMERYSSSTREISQEGRRGALMISISCFSDNTLILTDNGWMNIVNIINDINNGTTLFAIDDNGNPNKILNPIINEPEILYEIETEDGTKLEVTGNHKFEVKNIVTGELYLKELKDINVDEELFKIINS